MTRHTTRRSSAAGRKAARVVYELLGAQDSMSKMGNG